jgi:hypothetical protein
VRVLLSDGSGLTARQAATQLAAAGHTVEVLSADPLALTRFTRHVHRLRRVPAYGLDPFGWLEAALATYRRGDFDVLLPTQEQVAVLSASAERLEAAGVTTAVPPFEALVKVQDKLSAFVTLTELGLPQPDTTIVGTVSELAAWDRFPVFVKRPIGTAATGVRRVADHAEIAALASAWDGDGGFADGGVLVQAPVEGTLVMAQSVFDAGRLVASHANVRVREGASGGASHKRSIDLPDVRDHLRVLGDRLGWHGALAADVILAEQGPLYIDINPRLVEPGNAWRAGVDLVTAMLEVACGTTADVEPPGRPGVATHQLLLAVLGAAEHEGRRAAVATELVSALRRRGSYVDSYEELTPVRHDPLSAVPVAVAAAVTLARPAAWRRLSAGAVTSYALSPAGWRRILTHPQQP